MSTFPADKRYSSGTAKRQIEWGEDKRSPYDDTDFKRQNRVSIDISNIFDAPGDPNPITIEDFQSIEAEALAADRDLKNGRGDCLDGDTAMLGWQDLPEKIADEYLAGITKKAKQLSSKIDAFVSLGIGGSYLGVEASIKMLTHTHFNSLSRQQRGGAPEIYFLGQNMDPDFFCDTLDMLAGKKVAVNVISKSGTTTETAIAFRILRELIEASNGEQAGKFIIATTDKARGALRKLADEKGYQTFIVPDDIGGRFSVLTDVGLFGIAIAGIDLQELLAGARDMRIRCLSEDFLSNPAMVHAAVRTLAWRKGKKIEVVATNSQALLQVTRWMEQLFPESEGHDGKGLFVASSMYSEKLHANGQLVQEGERNLIETFLKLGQYHSTVPIPSDPDNLDGLNYLSDSGKDMGFINGLVIDGPAFAHRQGGVPNLTVHIPARNAYCLGQLYYLMERSVAISGYLLGVNPFIQPGVEAYKKAMFALAGKPGFEQEGTELQKQLAAIKKTVVK